MVTKATECTDLQFPRALVTCHLGRNNRHISRTNSLYSFARAVPRENGLSYHNIDLGALGILLPSIELLGPM